MIAMRLSTPQAASVKAVVKAFWKWVVGGGLLLALMMTVVQCSIERHNAHEASIQTYNMGRVAAFRDSGAELDKKVAAFADDAAEGRTLTDSRRAVRSALADHASKTMAMQDAFGDAATTAYTSDLKGLQSAVEDTTDATNSGAILTAMSRVYLRRNKLADGVVKRASS